jgi:MOSC domain-containing protein YiiM
MIRHIFIAPLKNAPAQSVSHVQAQEGQGLEGDRYAEAGNREGPASEVTFIELEAIRAFTEATNLAMTPAMPRRNIVTEGVRLNPLVGRRFHVGEAVFEGLELCEPCGKFARATHRGRSSSSWAAAACARASCRAGWCGSATRSGRRRNEKGP